LITALLLAGLLDPDCIPRRAHAAPASKSKDISLAAAFAYPRRSHLYQAPARPVCREPWPGDQLQDVPLSDLPRSPVPVPPRPLDLGHSPVVIWPGYVSNGPQPIAHGRPAIRPPATVSLSEPPSLTLLVLALAVWLGVHAASRRFARERARARKHRGHSGHRTN